MVTMRPLSATSSKMSNADKLIRKVEKLEDELEDSAQKALDVSMGSLEREIKWQLTKQRSIATGTLHSNIRTMKKGSGTGKRIANVGIYGPDYWRFLEYGTGIYTSRGYKAPSGGAPYEDILRWVTAKGITPTEDSIDTQEELAAAIANSITTGTKSHKFVRPAWRGPRGEKQVKQTVFSAMQSAVDRTF